MISLNIKNETDPLEAVIVGTARSFGGTPELEDAYDPKSKWHIQNGSFPLEPELVREVDGFVKVLEKHGVKVYRPEIIEDLNQIFSRDIAFVVDEKLILPNIIEDRRGEIKALKPITEQIDPAHLLTMPKGMRAEGGDVMPWNEFLFVGFSEPKDFTKYTVSRTNAAGLHFLKKHFPNRQVRGFQLAKSDTDPRQNALHLDCCFQPIGKDKAILFPGGFKNPEDVDFIRAYFGAKNIFEIDREEMFLMYSNIFSITPELVVSDKSFTRLNYQLENWGIKVESIPYNEVAKMEGLLRCSTMPLKRNPG